MDVVFRFYKKDNKFREGVIMYMCEDCNYIYDGDICVKCPQCGSIDVDETKPTIIKSSDAVLVEAIKGLESIRFSIGENCNHRRDSDRDTLIMNLWYKEISKIILKIKDSSDNDIIGIDAVEGTEMDREKMNAYFYEKGWGDCKKSITKK